MNAARELIDVFCGIDRPAVMKRFFSEIFTPAEIDDFVLRWRLMSMLDDGVPQRTIAARLGISLCKITRGARILKAKNSVTGKILRTRSEIHDGSKQKTQEHTGYGRILR